MDELNEKIETITGLIEEKKFFSIKEMFGNMEPADIAAIIESFPSENFMLLFRILPKDLAADTFVEMGSDNQEILLGSFTDNELKDVIDELFIDDTVDIIEEMPANVVTRVLSHANPETRSLINQIMHYPHDSAGSIMTVEYVELKETMTVADSFTRIRRTGVDKETIYTCYVTDDKKKLVGVVTVKDLLLASYETLISGIMETNIISVNTNEDKEETAALFNKYNFLALPVVDNENRLVGIVTVDDAIDVIQDENTEDIERMAAIMPTDKPYSKTGVFETWKKRIPWLLLLMVSATFTSKILTHFESALAVQTALIAFIPMLMDTGGNAGGQASVTIIRGLSLGEISMRDILRVVWKELRVALMCGISLAVVNYFKMLLIDKTTTTVALVVCITLVAAVTFAKLIGCTLPILAKRIGFDPAVMASPFITTVVDALSLLVYFKVASFFFKF